MKTSKTWARLALDIIMLAPLFMSVGILAYIATYDLLIWVSQSFP